MPGSAFNKKISLCLIFIVALSFIIHTDAADAAKSNKPKFFLFRWLSKVFHQRPKKDMGNVTRAMSYSISKNEQSAISALEFNGTPLSWFRLDDGVMGGQSQTIHVAKDGLLHFDGTINTNGGGFTSIRAKLNNGALLTSDTTGLHIRYRGDGKTYKVLLSDGNRGGPFSRTPTWQADLPTRKREDESWDEVTIPFTSLHPAFGGGPKSQPSAEEKTKYTFNPTEMNEVGLMLSLRLSDGSPNPPETFGTGIFPFSLKVQSLTVIKEAPSSSK